MKATHMPRYFRRHLLATLLLLVAGACSDDGGTTPDSGDRVATVVVAPERLALMQGEARTLTASARAANGRVVPGKTFEWTSADQAVATVSARGEVKAIAPGTTTILAISEGRAGSLSLTVHPQPVASVEITPAGSPQSISVGGTRQLGTIIRAADGTELIGRTVTWASSAVTVAQVSASGLLDARGIGTASISATVEGKAAEIQIVVTSPVVAVHVDPAVTALAVGEVAQITAQPRGADNIVVNRPVAWSTSDPSVATVNASGRVTGKSKGTAVITATSDGKSGVAYILVDTWAEQPLLAVGDAAPPTTLFVYTEPDGDGSPRTVRYQVTEGRLRLLGAGERYELEVYGWLFREGGAAIQMLLGSVGTYRIDLWEGGYIFEPGISPPFRGRITSPGTLSVTWRPDPKAPEVRLVFRAP